MLNTRDAQQIYPNKTLYKSEICRWFLHKVVVEKKKQTLIGSGHVATLRFVLMKYPAIINCKRWFGHKIIILNKIYDISQLFGIYIYGKSKNKKKLLDFWDLKKMFLFYRVFFRWDYCQVTFVRQELENLYCVWLQIEQLCGLIRLGVIIYKDKPN